MKTTILERLLGLRSKSSDKGIIVLIDEMLERRTNGSAVTENELLLIERLVSKPELLRLLAWISDGKEGKAFVKGLKEGKPSAKASVLTHMCIDEEKQGISRDELKGILNNCDMETLKLIASVIL